MKYLLILFLFFSTNSFAQSGAKPCPIYCDQRILYQDNKSADIEVSSNHPSPLTLTIYDNKGKMIFYFNNFGSHDKMSLPLNAGTYKAILEQFGAIRKVLVIVKK